MTGHNPADCCGVPRLAEIAATIPQLQPRTETPMTDPSDPIAQRWRVSDDDPFFVYAGTEHLATVTSRLELAEHIAELHNDWLDRQEAAR